MKNSGLLYTLFLLSLVLVGCSGIPQSSNAYTYNTSVDFAKFRSYGWYNAEVPKPRAGGAGPQFNVLLDERVREAVASELFRDGLQLDAEKPDILVAYDLAVDSSQTPGVEYTFPEGFGYGYSYWFGYRFRYSTAGLPNYRPVQQYPAGTLIIDLIDPNTNQLIWRGTKEAGINPTSQDLQRINLAVADIMAQFPPNPLERRNR